MTKTEEVFFKKYLITISLSLHFINTKMKSSRKKKNIPRRAQLMPAVLQGLSTDAIDPGS